MSSGPFPRLHSSLRADILTLIAYWAFHLVDATDDSNFIISSHVNIDVDKTENPCYSHDERCYSPLPQGWHSRLGIALSVLFGAILLICGCCCCYGFPFSIPGVIVSSIALARLKKDSTQQPGKGLALAGLVLSIVGIVLGVTLLAFGIAANGSDWLRKLQSKWGQ